MREKKYHFLSRMNLNSDMQNEPIALVIIRAALVRARLRWLSLNVDAVKVALVPSAKVAKNKSGNA